MCFAGLQQPHTRAPGDQKGPQGLVEGWAQGAIKYEELLSAFTWGLGEAGCCLSSSWLNLHSSHLLSVWDIVGSWRH